jgi:hypothetical protein
MSTRLAILADVARTNLRDYTRLVDDYAQALGIVIALLPAVDEGKLSDAVRTQLPTLREQAHGALERLPALREAVEKHRKQFGRLKWGTLK